MTEEKINEEEQKLVERIEKSQRDNCPYCGKLTADIDFCKDCFSWREEQELRREENIERWKITKNISDESEMKSEMK